MRNRAKCKLCEDIIESKHLHDYVTCKCGEIAVDGGQEYFRCGIQTSWKNFLRIEEDGTIKEVTYVEPEEPKETVEAEANEYVAPVLSRAEKIQELERFFDHIVFESLPDHAKFSFVTQAQFQSLGLLLVSILLED